MSVTKMPWRKFTNGIQETLLRWFEDDCSLKFDSTVEVSSCILRRVFIEILQLLPVVVFYVVC